jgi:hypothetical protein
MKLTAIQTASMVSAVVLIGFPGTALAGGPPNPTPSPAPAQSYQFQNSSGNVSCNLGGGSAACEISNRAYTPPGSPPPCAQHSAWGDRVSLAQGEAVQFSCHNDTLHVQGEETLANGQTLTSGSLSCAADAATMRCTDSGTGHFFFLSPNSFQEG